jgi:hypothetical protein
MFPGVAQSLKPPPGPARPLFRRLHPKEELVLGFMSLAAALPALLVSCVLAGPILDGSVRLLPCFHKTVFHRECMTCGMTRSFSAMWKGKVDLASAYNRGGPATFVAFWVAALLGALFVAHGIISYRRFKRRKA